MQRSQAHRKMRRNNNKLSNRRNVKKQNVQYITSNKLVIMREPGRYMPDRYRVKLMYNDTTFQRIRTSNTVTNWYWRSSAYDPDPALGSGAIPGFAELANFYKAYLVRSMTLKLSIANNNGDASTIGVWSSNTLHNTNSLAATDIVEYSANPGSQYKIIPNGNAGPTNLVVKAVGSELYGRQFLNDLTFTGSTGGNPGTMYGINVGIFDNAAQNWTYGFPIKAAIEFDIEFFEIIRLQS